MEVIAKGSIVKALQDEMMPARDVRFKIRRADKRWKNGTPFNMPAR